MSVEQKIASLEVCLPVFDHIRAVKSTLEGQRDAKAKASGEWFQGYATAMDDAIKALDELLRDYS